MPSTQQSILEETEAAFTHSHYCWVAGLTPARNQFVSFELRFHLKRNLEALIHVFADSRYRLFVNEEFVAYGPGRFVTQNPEYDTYQLSPWLQPGENLIRVEVNYYGCPSFQTMPDGRPGFIADGGDSDGTISFSTPGRWVARIHHAWKKNSPPFSFAQNSIENCDTRILESELRNGEAVPINVITEDSTPWSMPTPRSVPYPDYAIRRPLLLTTSGPVVSRHYWGVQLHHPNFQPSKKHSNPLYVSYACWIRSPRKQSVKMDCFWSEPALNGHTLEIQYPGNLGNHSETILCLRKGWNLLSGNIQLLQEEWPLLFGFPSDAGLSLHAMPSFSCADAFALSSPQSCRPKEQFLQSASTFSLPLGWDTYPNNIESVTPARLSAWAQLQPGTTAEPVALDRKSKSSTLTAETALWCYNFGTEYFGHFIIDVEAPEGTTLDISYDDWQREDGCVYLYHTNPYINATDRFILRGGRQRIEVLNPRGGIFLQIILRVRSCSGPAELTIHDVAIRQRTTIRDIEGSFSSESNVLNWTWQTSIRTLQTSTDESYNDCPWRERSCYIGDSLVNLHLHRLISSDLSLARHSLQLFSEAQFPNGHLPACAPSWIGHHHGDFTLLWIQAIRDYWAYTGDSEFLDSQWSSIERILTKITWKCDESTLWNSTGENLFLDWGVRGSEREGAGNSALNILRVAALRAASEVADILGKTAAAKRFAYEADITAHTVVGRLWNSQENCFNISILNPKPGLHASILALRYNIGPAHLLLKYLEPELQANFQTARSLDSADRSYVELYFFHYLLPALALHNRHQLAEALIQETYGFLKSLGHCTLVERFRRADYSESSCCHSWSGAPAHYITHYLLGLRQARPGRLDEYVLDPANSSHMSMQGTFPHSKGRIQIRWQRIGERISAEAYLPKCITLIPSSQVDLVCKYRPEEMLA